MLTSAKADFLNRLQNMCNLNIFNKIMHFFREMEVIRNTKKCRKEH